MQRKTCYFWVRNSLARSAKSYQMGRYDVFSLWCPAFTLRDTILDDDIGHCASESTRVIRALTRVVGNRRRIATCKGGFDEEVFRYHRLRIMVVLLDLNQDELHTPYHAGHELSRRFPLLQKHEVETRRQPDYEDERPNPNVNAFSQALGSYP